MPRHEPQVSNSLDVASEIRPSQEQIHAPEGVGSQSMNSEVPVSSNSGHAFTWVRVLAALLTLVSILLLIAIGFALILVHPRYQIGTLVSDDAGYYLAIARNYGLGFGYSFDRIHATNGFNPLLPIILVTLNKALSPDLDLEACFRIATLVTWTALLLGLAPLRKFARRVLAAFDFPDQYRELAVASVTFFYVAFVGLKSYYGMDGFLVLGLALLWLGLVSDRGLLSSGIWSAFVSGGLLGAVVLARVDSIPFALAAFGLMIFRAVSGQGPMRAVILRAAVFLAIVIPYFVINRIRFGDWLPISAKLKSSFPKIDPISSLDAVLHTSLNGVDIAVLFISFVLALGWSTWFLLRGRKSAIESQIFARDAMAVLAVYLTLRILWLLLFSRFDVQGGYYVLAAPFLSVALLVLAGRCQARRAALVGCVTFLAATVGLMAGKAAKVVPSIRNIAAGADEWALGRRIHNSVANDDVIYGGAFGLVGYVADRSWINGDGVANDRAYQDVIESGRLRAYLACAGVTHIAISRHPPSNPPAGPVTVDIRSPLHNSLDKLVIDRQDEPVLNGDLIRGGGIRVFLLPWSVPRSFDRAQCDSESPSGLAP